MSFFVAIGPSTSSLKNVTLVSYVLNLLPSLKNYLLNLHWLMKVQIDALAKTEFDP